MHAAVSHLLELPGNSALMQAEPRQHGQRQFSTAVQFLPCCLEIPTEELYPCDKRTTHSTHQQGSQCPTKGCTQQAPPLPQQQPFPSLPPRLITQHQLLPLISFCCNSGVWLMEDREGRNNRLCQRKRKNRSLFGVLATQPPLFSFRRMWRIGETPQTMSPPD